MPWFPHTAPGMVGRLRGRRSEFCAEQSQMTIGCLFSWSSSVVPGAPFLAMTPRPGKAAKKNTSPDDDECHGFPYRSWHRWAAGRSAGVVFVSISWVRSVISFRNFLRSWYDFCFSVRRVRQFGGWMSGCEWHGPTARACLFGRLETLRPWGRVSFLKWEDRHRPAPLRNEGKPCGVIRNRREAAVSGANPELADRLFSETLAGTGS